MNIEELFFGTQSIDLPTISTGTITGANVNTGAICGIFERGAVGVHELTDVKTAPKKFGNILQSAYGMFGITSFFTNLQGVTGRLLVKRFIPDDATEAAVTLMNQNSVLKYKFSAGAKGKIDPGYWGNRLYVLPVTTSRDSTSLTAATTVGNNAYIAVSFIGSIASGDWLKIGGTTNFKARVSRVDEIEGRIYLNTNAGVVVASGQTVSVLDFTIKVYLKDKISGSLDLVETWANLNVSNGSAYNAEDTINSETSGSDFITLDVLVTPEDNTFQELVTGVVDAIANIIPLVGGTEGTALTPIEMASQYTDFNKYDFTYFGNMESFSESVWDDGESYANSTGKAIWVGCPTKNMDFATAVLWANRRRRTRKMYAFNNLNWYEWDDPTSNKTRKVREIPNIGAIMGYSIYITSLRGIHHVPASKQQVLSGVRGVVGEIIDRAEIAKIQSLGLNVTSNIDGAICIRAGRTPSKLPEFKYVNGILMSIFFKKTFENSFSDLENEVSGVALLSFMAQSMNAFCLQFYSTSSNGGTEKGFASYLKPDGSPSSFNDVCKIVVLDPVLNPASQMAQGLVRANMWFAYPAPAEKFLIGVGIIYNF